MYRTEKSFTFRRPRRGMRPSKESRGSVRLCVRRKASVSKRVRDASSALTSSAFRICIVPLRAPLAAFYRPQTTGGTLARPCNPPRSTQELLLGPGCALRASDAQPPTSGTPQGRAAALPDLFRDVTAKPDRCRPERADPRDQPPRSAVAWTSPGRPYRDIL